MQQRTKAESLELTDQLAEFLNELIEIDPEAVHRLVEARVPCNRHLMGHPTVQVLRVVDNPETSSVVGFLGIINGFIGADTDGWGFLCGIYDDDKKLIRFKRSPPRASKKDDNTTDP
jgi:hypothetical protein